MFLPEKLREWVRGIARRLTGTEQPQSTTEKAEGQLDGDNTASTGPEKGGEQDESNLSKQSSIYPSGTDSNSNVSEKGSEQHAVPPQETSPTINHPEDNGSFLYSDSETVVDTTLTCRVCIGPQPTASFPHSALITAQCDHPARTCRACTQTWVQTQLLASNDWAHLACPECPAPMTHHDVQQHATPEMFAKYRAAVQERPALRLSATLPDMGAAAAAKHGEEAKHRERDEARRQKPAGLFLRWRQERASRRTILATTSECPNPACKVRMEKADGW